MYGFGVFCLFWWDGRPEDEATGSSQVVPLGHCLSTALGSCELTKSDRGTEIPLASFDIDSRYAQVQVACHLAFTCVKAEAFQTARHTKQAVSNRICFPGLTYPFTWKSKDSPGRQRPLQKSISAQVLCAGVASSLDRHVLDRKCLDMRCRVRHCQINLSS